MMLLQMYFDRQTDQLIDDASLFYNYQKIVNIVENC